MFSLPIEENLIEVLKVHGHLDDLNKLADRGIILSSWQANQYYLGGKGLGKTFLSQVTLIENLLKSTSTSKAIHYHSTSINNLDEMLHTVQGFKEYGHGLVDIAKKYYSDEILVEVKPYTIYIRKAAPRCGLIEIKRWW